MGHEWIVAQEGKKRDVGCGNGDGDGRRDVMQGRSIARRLERVDVKYDTVSERIKLLSAETGEEIPYNKLRIEPAGYENLYVGGELTEKSGKPLVYIELVCEVESLTTS